MVREHLLNLSHSWLAPFSVGPPYFLGVLRKRAGPPPPIPDKFSSLCALIIAKGKYSPFGRSPLRGSQLTMGGPRTTDVKMPEQQLHS